jgi:hypothetical protein
LEDFARTIGADILADTVANFLGSAAANVATNALEANNQMAQGGFTQYITNVYQYVLPMNVITFYCAAPASGFIGCAPFLRQDGRALVEGPVITGLSLSAQNWQSTAVPPADGLLILKASADNTSSNFNKTSPRPYVFRTPAGTLEMQYSTTYPQEQKGLVSVVAKKDNGGVLHGEDYLINWA